MERIALAFSPLRDASPRDIVSWSRDAEERGYEAVFIPESYCDSLAYAEAVALATSRLRVGTGVTNIYLRQPTLLAAEAAAVQELSGGRLLLGVGVGHRAVNEPLGVDMSDPVGTMRSVIGTLRAAWTKGPTQPRPAVPPRILAAALALRMIRAAWTRRDVAAAERAVSDALADAVTLVGDPVRCRERVAAYRAAGATLTIVFPNPVGEPRAAAVARALAAFAPR